MAAARSPVRIVAGAEYIGTVAEFGIRVSRRPFL